MRSTSKLGTIHSNGYIQRETYNQDCPVPTEETNQTKTVLLNVNSQNY